MQHCGKLAAPQNRICGDQGLGGPELIHQLRNPVSRPAGQFLLDRPQPAGNLCPGPVPCLPRGPLARSSCSDATNRFFSPASVAPSLPTRCSAL